ncbi:LysE family translocator [Herbidospora galbida]|uniref:LysE family translocator n=1 Tax=Herbidospora galbida TaxID=2575442 RepID=UPI001FEB3E98|nr:LysE family translocator [Herbidospora galbida]
MLALAVAGMLLSLVPGPDLLFVVTSGVLGGRRAGVLAALGMSAGLVVQTVAAAFGLGVLIQSAPQALQIVRLFGAAVLVYMAVAAWRSSRTAEPLQVSSAPRRSLRRTYVMATLTNLANPKVILFYLAFLPQFLTTGEQAWPVTAQMLILGGMFILVGLAVYATAALVSGILSEKFTARPQWRRTMQRVSAVVFGGLAARLVIESRVTARQSW